ncbi:MAG: quinoprotein dehydrogenase-associated putative ABC transporter substrate-binding protein [Betaproteobacteria bacterium]|nr:quinoprotein dehydrogenase-associated putative ABC transporter substrate-binding protein [Betaproteobacteria bacterium]NBY53111.1 quinoprotein dehydrogenase-associated putative ABC transporter substrate-binding protein [Betaproteobacteria bacterium]NCA23276.1 quinoprotein dehydrogenase-associated putative ABC transporter substrate-binding protein [Betaproteobacteria bacterium]NCU84936.1 quinoprotein dehydrogenase-associated putative ABC transporter substrate-binding protein [Betaproteobacteri
MKTIASTLAGAVFTAAALVAPQAQAATAQEKGILRVCADPNSMPFSNQAGEGLENRIAEMMAKDFGWKVEFFFFPQRMAFFRNSLKAKAADGEEGYKCDLATSSAPEAEGAVATKTYYTSTWTMVMPAGKGLDAIRQPDDLLKLPKDQLAKLRFGVFPASPGADWVLRNGFDKQMVPFQQMLGDPNSYPGQMVDVSLVKGDIDVAFIWGPIGSYHARQSKAVKLRVVPMVPDAETVTDFSIAMAVRYREPEWKAKVEDFLTRRKADIDKVMADYGVPLVQTDGSVLVNGERFDRPRK